MEIQYIRKWMSSYMVLPQEKQLHEWEEKMISHVVHFGVIFAECICEDGRKALWYDITGKQSLDAVLEEEKLDYELLCQLLLGIYKSAEGLEEILFCAEHILLLPESIFLNCERKQVSFCYYPQNVQNIAESFLQLMEYLLMKLDHEDDRAVELAYHIYEQAEKGQWSFGELKKSIVLTYQSEEEQDRKSAAYNISEKKLEEAETAAGGRKEAEEYEEETAWQTEMAAGKDKKPAAILKMWTEQLKKCVYAYLPDYIVQRIGSIQRSYKNSEREQKEQFVFEPEEEEEEPVLHPTVLLEQVNHAIQGVLRYEGSGACENLVIAGEEYLIGSDEGCAGYIPNQAVSRRHAKISRVGDVYMIEDLNSRNGTYVGGMLLNYRTKISLQKNEIVIFADEKFRFI